MQEKRVFLTRIHPRKHAQETIFVIYNVFLHISNTDFDPQKSAMATAEKTSQRFQRFPSSPCPSPVTHLPRPLPLLLGWCSLYFGSMLVHLGTMLVPILFLLVFLLCFWLSCFGSRWAMQQWEGRAVYGNRKFTDFAATNYWEIGWIWRRAMYGLTWSMISWVFVYLTNENEDIYVSTFGCCVTSACAPKRLAARRSSMKWNVK